MARLLMLVEGQSEETFVKLCWPLIWNNLIYGPSHRYYAQNASWLAEASWEEWFLILKSEKTH